MSITQTSPPVTVAPCAFCLLCRCPIYIEDSLYLNYFSNKPIICHSCTAPVDLWECILKAIKDKPATPGAPLLAIGAIYTILNLQLQPFTPEKIVFSDHGIPDKNLILDVNYTPVGEPFFLPLEVHGNRPNRGAIGKSVTIYAAPFDRAHQGPVNVLVVVMSIPHSEQDVVWKNLTKAFSAYYFEDYEDCIIPANVSVEFALNRLITQALEKHNLTTSVVDALLKKTTYDYQLKKLLKEIINSTEAKNFPKEILEKLSCLTELRNTLAHKGHILSSSSANEIAELICAALFGVHYISYVRHFLGF